MKSFEIKLKPEYARTLTREEYSTARRVARIMRRMMDTPEHQKKVQEAVLDLLIYGYHKMEEPVA